MPNPSSSLSTLRPDLAESFQEFDLAMNQQGYIGHQVLPVMEVQNASGVFGKIPIEQLLQERDTARAPGGGYNRGNWKFTTDSFATTEQGAEEPVDENEAKLYADYFDAEQVSAMRAYDAVMGAAERRVAASVFNATTWTPTNVSVEWSTIATSAPLTDVENRVKSIFAATGLKADTLILSWTAYRNLRRCAQLIERLESAGAGQSSLLANIGPMEIARAMDLRQVLVAGAVTNSANEGQTAALSEVWSTEYAAVCKLNSGPDIREPGLGRTFHWAADGSQPGGTVEDYLEPQTRSKIIRVRHQVQEKIIFPEALELLGNITA